MPHPRRFAVSVLLLSCLFATAKDKKKALLPADVLRARSVLVLVDPNSGMDVQNPNANRTAQEDVEKALMNWGRFSLAMDAENADLIITVRKGSGKIVQPTIGGVPNNNRPVILEPTDSGGRIGVRPGNPAGAGDPPEPQPQVQVGQSQDTFVVYRGSSKDQECRLYSDGKVRWNAAFRRLQCTGLPPRREQAYRRDQDPAQRSCRGCR